MIRLKLAWICMSLQAVEAEECTRHVVVRSRQEQPFVNGLPLNERWDLISKKTSGNRYNLSSHTNRGSSPLDLQLRFGLTINCLFACGTPLCGSFQTDAPVRGHTLYKQLKFCNLIKTNHFFAAAPMK
ncbi:hypothetical protein WA026_008747 [Henosepilachna vigintioctopunctata]|uniref:Secreted protein n=1 Tax=Henosepilachna vigintioctopunctata TaxID=420089 RepID=A0AAW1VC47_9CUCU